ncbi:uncharacterized protein TRAVEDRAFT_51476 [Trametes versicolor FP-101664 SS1]|uniref:uncharacterized protein n=1 Tax=Trametes versicolor (strain FP-101664) TaxID=717944 RepID=UPI0004624745|nr:uncharacterized protein TRAVEDRAFT_51476 [Trametes versicolor FP-101664 SS1]EIW55352.1 hypothetical protein TRAVEDRAFT_51476 [Trametes versicolor FP-101664 SS1]
MALSETSHAEDLAFAIKVPALDNTFGALLLGTFLGLVLYGLTLHQGYRYTRFPAYDKDSKWPSYSYSKRYTPL